MLVLPGGAADGGGSAVMVQTSVLCPPAPAGTVSIHGVMSTRHPLSAVRMCGVAGGRADGRAITPRGMFGLHTKRNVH